ncbi:MAG: four helix bundle suffix domain-containing protein [Kiritimatiellaeota bacterium]|nr:four helix bundle suffix domain-containing protein [Kiritimatiellota bacterium]
MDIFLNYGGYRRLDSYIIGNIIQLATLDFCRRFISLADDPKGRLYDQITQAARSGIKNVVEGSERIKTSVADCIRLIDVGRGSLCELRDDYITWLLDKKKHPPWPHDSAEARAVFGVRLDPANYGDDLNHDASVHILAQKQKFAPWLDSKDSEIVANALLILINREVNMLTQQLAKLAEDFKQHGGIHERMTAARVEAKREAQEPVNEDAPHCPKCGQLMRLQNGRNGKFWSCGAYPTCKGTRNIAR